MCGVTGFLRSPEESDARLREVARAMTDTLVHRGPDDSGIWTEASSGIALGFRRLSILDLSPTGHQPMCSHDGRYVISFNGEIYNYRELRKELEHESVEFRGTSDTETILEGVSRWGFEATLGRLWGMFAIALWDRAEKRLLLARDRIGKKPLYYGWADGTLLFGSELKALRAHPSCRPEIDREALALYVRFGYVPEPFSIFRGIRKLPKGHYGTASAGRPLELHAYWSARSAVEAGLKSPLTLSDREATDELESRLRDAVGRRMIADVPLGAFLSGGIDSTTVVALMQAQSARPVKTFTIGFHEEPFNEARHAKAVAEHLRTDHTELYVTPGEAQAVIPRLPDIYDEPFADSSQIPTFLVSQLARREVTVSLSGDGGDELFAGYSRYLWAERIWNWQRAIPHGARRLASALATAVSPRRWDAFYGAMEKGIPPRWRQALVGDKVHKLAALLAAPDREAVYEKLVSLWKTPRSLVIGASEVLGAPPADSLPSNLASFTEWMMFRDLTSYLPDDILVKVDRASMAVSLEARNPLLDHRLVEWVWRLPLLMKKRGGTSKWLLRQVLYRHVPKKLVERPKVGFGVPIDSWLRGPLRDWAESLLDERRLRNDGLLEPAPVREAWEAHLGGRQNEQYRLWVILMFQSWKERWVG